MAQRLIRKVCKNCGAERPATPDEMALLKEASGTPQEKLMAGPGCSECRQSAYRGQIGIFELLMAYDIIRDKIQSRTNAIDIRESAISAGMQLLRTDGLKKIATGITTPAEVQRVTMRATM